MKKIYLLLTLLMLFTGIGNSYAYTNWDLVIWRSDTSTYQYNVGSSFLSSDWNSIYYRLNSSNNYRAYKKTIWSSWDGTAIFSSLPRNFFKNPNQPNIIYYGTSDNNLIAYDETTGISNTILNSWFRWCWYWGCSFLKWTNKLIYFSFAGGWQSLWYVDLDNISSNKQILPRAWWPNISPDGKTLFYTDARWRQRYKRDVDFLNNPSPICSDFNSCWYWTQVSSDYIYSPNWDFYLYKNDTDGWKLYKKLISWWQESIILDNNSYSSIIISPDGKYFVYINTIDSKIYIKSLISSDKPTIFVDSNATPMYFSPDSKNLFYYDWARWYPTIVWTNYVYKKSLLNSDWDSNWNYNHYILNRMTATEGNMQQVNNSAGSTSFSNSNQVKSNFLNNYTYMQSWYESKGLTLDVINNNVDWWHGVTFSKTDVAWGMLDWYKLSAHYPFMSYKETDNTDSTIYWRTDLINTWFQTDTTWNNVGLPVFPIKNGSGTTIAYLEFPCWNLICKDQYCSDIKKIVNPTPINPIHETVFSDPGNGLPYCWDWIKNTMDEECDWNDWIKHDQGETCNSQCKVVINWWTPWCFFYTPLGYVCNGSNKVPIFPINSTQNPPGWWTGTTVINTGSIINWTPPGNITIPVIWDINTNTWMTDTEKTISKDVICSSIDEWFKNNKTIIVTNTMADTTFLRWLKGKDEFIKTLSGSSTEVADKIIQKKLKSEKLNEKSSTYDLWAGWDISWIQFNLTKIPNSAIMRKLVDLAIDHSSTTMADYEQTIKDSCNNSSTITGKEVVPAWFIDVNEKGETILNLFRFNWN